MVTARPYALLIVVACLACSDDDGRTPGDTSAMSDGPSAGTGAGGHAGTTGSAGSAGATAGTSGTSGAAGRAGEANAGSGGNGGSSGPDVPDGSAGVDAGPDASTADEARRPGWTLVWRDEFDGPGGSSPDPARWLMETGGDGWGNAELEFYTDRTDNAALDGDGALVITAREEAYMGRDHTSARLTTQGKLEQTFGRFEARLDIPEGQGIWPAFWMLGDDIGSTGWPDCGEIDVMENIGREPTLVHGTLHGPGYSGGNGIGASYSLPGDAPFADDYHVYAIEWEAEEVRWYVDDVLFQTRTPADLPQGAAWVYDHPFFILLNVAVGGQWPGNPDSTTTFPQELRIDYVRVYEPS